MNSKGRFMETRTGQIITELLASLSPEAREKFIAAMDAIPMVTLTTESNQATESKRQVDTAPRVV